MLATVTDVDIWLFPEINENDITDQIRQQIALIRSTKQTLPEPLFLKQTLSRQFDEYQLNLQQDPMELITRLFNILPDDPFQFKITEISNCRSCNYKKTSYLQNNHFKYVFTVVQNSMQKLIETMQQDNTTRQNRCENCHQNNINNSIGETHDIQTMTSQYPKVLIVHLSRFTETMTKNNSPFLFADSEIIDHTTYRLRSIICHYGHTLHNGHYVVIKKNQFSNEFYKFNDKKVTLCNDIKSYQENVYLLLYEKI